MPIYRFRHFRRPEPENSPAETELADREFHADSREEALVIKNGLAEGFNPATDFAELLDAEGTVVWRDGYRA